MQNKRPFEIILRAGRVTSLQSWVGKKSCHGQTLTNECSVSDYPSNFEGLQLALHAVLFQTVFCFAFLGKKSRQKAIEIETALFHSLENPNWIISFMLHISIITDELVEIFLKLSMKTVQVHLIIWTTLS